MKKEYSNIQSIKSTYINTTNFNDTRTRLLQSIANQSSSFGFTFSGNNGGLQFTRSKSKYDLFLFGTSDDELGLFSALQSNLLLFNGIVEVLAESKMGDGDIIELDVVFISTLFQQFRNTLRDLFSFCEQLFSIILSNDGLHDFITQGRKDTVAEIRTDLSVDLWQVFQVRMGQNSERNTNGLEILGTSLGRNFTRGSTDIVLVGILKITTSSLKLLG